MCCKTVPCHVHGLTHTCDGCSYHKRTQADSSVEATYGATFVPKLDDLLTAADFVVLACPCNAETEGMIGAHELAVMGPETYLVNVGRGKLVNTDAVVAALHDRIIAGYATDGTLAAALGCFGAASCIRVPP